jgi:hypothetical protein
MVEKSPFRGAPGWQQCRALNPFDGTCEQWLIVPEGEKLQFQDIGERE